LPIGGSEVSVLILKSQQRVGDGERIGAGAFRRRGDQVDLAALGESSPTAAFWLLRALPHDLVGVVFVQGEVAAAGFAVGQEMFISMMSTSGTSTSRAMASKSSAVVAVMLATIGGVKRL